MIAKIYFDCENGKDVAFSCEVIDDGFFELSIFKKGNEGKTVYLSKTDSLLLKSFISKSVQEIK